jgi:hypothetical protein
LGQLLLRDVRKELANGLGGLGLRVADFVGFIQNNASEFAFQEGIVFFLWVKLVGPRSGLV